MHNTTMLSTVNHWKFPEIYSDSTLMYCSYFCVSLQLGEETIHWAHSSESTTWFECPRKSFAFFVGFFPLAITFKVYCCHWFREWHFIPHLFSFLVLVDKTIYLPVFSVASIIFGFCIISYAEFQSCVLKPFKGVI